MSIELSGAMRTNLASLSRTQNLIDETQKRLATGLRVSSALDNPQNYFAAQGLDNRASDLSRLLDGIGQSVSTLEQTDNALQTLTDFVNQADSIATSASEALNDVPEASISGTADLSGVSDLTNLGGINDGSTLSFVLEDENGNDVSIVGGNSVTISGGDTPDDLIGAINNLRDAEGNQVLNASLSDEGHLEIEARTGGDLRITAEAGTGATTETGRTVLNSLGFSDLDAEEYNNAAAGASNEFSITASASTILESQSFRVANGTNIADGNTQLTAVQNSSGDSLFSGTGVTDPSATPSPTVGDQLVISVNGRELENIGDISTLTIQGTVEAINNNSDLNSDIRASYDNETGEFSIQSLNDNVDSIQIGARAGGTTATSVDFGFGAAGAQTANPGTPPAGTTNAANNIATESIQFGQGGERLAALEEDYNSVREQINQLVADSDYRGTNLLAGDELVTTFNEDRTNSLTTEGVDFSAEGLGLGAASFNNENNVNESLDATREALNEVRDFGSSIANDLSIIQTRQEFTQDSISTFQDGADKLTQANTNEEGANLLALQTRQQLGTSALSLASQSQQAVLRLF